MKFKCYAQLYVDFLAKEVANLADKNKCIDIFADVDLYRDEFEKLNKTMSHFASYKFIRQRKDRILSRIDLISRTGFLHGP